MGTRRSAAVDIEHPTSPTPEEIRTYLSSLLGSEAFSKSIRRAALLRYLVERTLAGDGERINEYAIGVDIFGKPPSFDPRLESIVRTEFSRLRQKLKEYYAGEGQADRIQLEFPQRSYLPIFSWRVAVSDPAAARAISRPAWPAVLVGAALVLGLTTALVWKIRSGPARTLSSVVILPFENLSPERHDNYIADGITEELTNDLAQRKELRVVARPLPSVFKGKNADIREIGRQLNVNNVAGGSLTQQPDGIRITAQLSRTSDGYCIWAHSYKTSLPNLMNVETQIAEGIAAELGNRDGRVPKIPLASSTKDPEAHELYLRANYERSLNTPESFKRSLALFQQAAQKDPNYVSAFVGIARTEISLLHLTQQPPAVAVPAAKAALETALQLDPTSAEARGILANLIAVYDWDWPRAEREFRQALADGAQASTYSFYGSLLGTRGRFREAEAQLHIAEDLDPLGMGPRFNLFMVLNLEHNYTAAKQVLRGMLEINPELIDAHFMRGVVAVAERDCATARNEFEWCAQKFPAPLTKIGLALAAACAGERGRARTYLAEAGRPDKAGYTSPYQLALGYAAAGDKETALSMLNKSADTREMQIFYIKYDPLLDGIRTDSRFTELETRIGLLTQ